MGIKGALNDPHSVLNNWDEFSVDPCSWTMITCSSDYLVIGLLVLLSSPILCLSLHSFRFFFLSFFFLIEEIWYVQGSAEPISLWNFVCCNWKFNKSTTSVRTFTASLLSHLSFYFTVSPLTSFNLCSVYHTRSSLVFNSLLFGF